MKEQSRTEKASLRCKYQKQGFNSCFVNDYDGVGVMNILSFSLLSSVCGVILSSQVCGNFVYIHHLSHSCSGLVLGIFC